MNMKKSIFFDLDGTLWDAISPLVDSYNETMIKHHYPYRFDYGKVKSCMGLTPEETGLLFFPDLEQKEGLDLFRLIVREEIQFLKNPVFSVTDIFDTACFSSFKSLDLLVVNI